MGSSQLELQVGKDVQLIWDISQGTALEQSREGNRKFSYRNFHVGYAKKNNNNKKTRLRSSWGTIPRQFPGTGKVLERFLPGPALSNHCRLTLCWGRAAERGLGTEGPHTDEERDEAVNNSPKSLRIQNEAVNNSPKSLWIQNEAVNSPKSLRIQGSG